MKIAPPAQHSSRRPPMPPPTPVATELEDEDCEDGQRAAAADEVSHMALIMVWTPADWEAVHCCRTEDSS
jgi:hypothetical protein